MEGQSSLKIGLYNAKKEDLSLKKRLLIKLNGDIKDGTIDNSLGKGGGTDIVCLPDPTRLLKNGHSKKV